MGRLAVLGALLFSLSGSASAQPSALPDLDVLYIERTPRYPGYSVRYDLPGRKGVPVLVHNKTRLPLSADQARKTQRWPALGEKVAFVAHVANRGNILAETFRFRWRINGKICAEGASKQPIEAGAESTFAFEWKWKPGRHTVSFEADPIHATPDACRHNNARTDATDAWSLLLAVDATTYKSFNANTNLVGTRSFEDWAQWHIDRMNALFDESPLPFPKSHPAWNLPRPRIRCDRVVVTDRQGNVWEEVLGKGVQPLDAGYDGGWHFAKREDCAAWAAQPDWGLIHEWGHQLGLTDLYALDREASENLVVDENGDPLLLGRRSTLEGTMMHGHGPVRFSEECMGALMTQAGRRRGYYGDHYFATPKQTLIRVLDRTGKPVDGALVEIWQDSTNRYAGRPVIRGRTGKDGLLPLPNRPAPKITTEMGYTLRPNPFGQIDVVGSGNVFFVRVAARGQSSHAWIDITHLNLRYWGGETERAVLVLPMPLPAASGPMAPRRVSAFAKMSVARVEWQAMPNIHHYRIYAQSGDRPYRLVTIVRTPPASSEARFADTLAREFSLSEHTLHRVVVTTVDAHGNESSFSKPVRVQPLVRPWGLAARPDGKLLVRDAALGQSVLYSADGRVIGPLGSVHLHFEGSYDLATDKGGRILSAKWGDGYNPNQGFKVQNPDFSLAFEVLAPVGSGPGQFNHPQGIAANAEGEIFVADTLNNRILQFSRAGEFLREIGSGELRLPMKCAFDSKNRLYVCDFGSNQIFVYEPALEGGYRLQRKIPGVKEPVSIALDPKDRLYVSGQRMAGVYRIGPDDKVEWEWHGEENDPVYLPRGLAFLQNGMLAVADEGGKRIRFVQPPDGPANAHSSG